MGKTLTNILTVGVALAVNVIPGVGQLISGTIFGALGTASGALATGIFTVVRNATALAGLQAGASLLGLGANIPKPETTEVPIKVGAPGVFEVLHTA